MQTPHSALRTPHLPDAARRDSQIHLRVSRRRKAAYVRAASAKPATLAAWCFEHLDKAAGHHEPET